MILALLLACSASNQDTGPSNTLEDGGSTGTDGGSTGTDGGSSSDGLSLTLDEEVVTMVQVAWPDRGASEAWVEYRFRDGDWQVAPAVSSSTAVLLGIPEQTEVEAVLVEVIDGVEARSEAQTIETGALPSWVLRPDVEAWDPVLGDTAPYAMVSMAGGDSYTFEGPWQLTIFTREGEVVWYRQVPDSLFVLYAQAALDGTHIWYDASDIFGMGQDSGHVMRLTLDGRWSQRIELANLGQAVDEGPDGSFFYESRSGRTGTTVSLMKIDAAGEVSTIWDCSDWIATLGEGGAACWMNATNWSEAHNTVLTSMFESDTVFEIDLDTGLPIRQMGQLTVGEPYSFIPEESMFAYQHYPYYTDEGTLMVSTHEVGLSGKQYAAEYVIDDATQSLTRIWSYESTDIWATQIGEAIRLRNGNTLQGYGQDGGVREVTNDGQEAWFVTWEKDNQGYRAMGHTELIDDLYALNRGPE